MIEYPRASAAERKNLAERIASGPSIAELKKRG